MKSVILFSAGILVGAVLMQTVTAQNGPILPRPARAVNHIGIVVDDYDAEYKFYTQVLGLKEAYTVDRDGRPLLTYLHANRETFVELIPARAGEATGITHYGLEVADIDATVARLRENGYDVADPAVTPANARYVMVRDPQNVRIEIMEYGPQSSQLKAMQTWDEANGPAH
jgi:catechol 2,3-dioxygenase-like lactoylglutathione lyase family enzyme